MYTISPMELAFALLIIFMFVAYGLTTLFRRWVDIPTLIGVAIGCAVNANLFTPLNYPIIIGPFTFSFEVVLYTLFMYTIVVRILDYGYQEAKKMTLTSVAAIIISAIIELFAEVAKQGFVVDVFKDFAIYLFSSIGTIIGVWVMVFITIRCREKKINSYLIIPFAIIASTLIHAVFYYGGICLVEWKFGIYTLHMFLGSLVGKGVCILLSMLCYYISQKFWMPLNLVSKENNVNNI